MGSATHTVLSNVTSLPDIASISTLEIESAMFAILDKIDDQLDEFEISVEPTWEGSLARLCDIITPLTFSWGIVNLLKSAKDDDALRGAHGAVQPRVIGITTRMAQSRRLYEALLKLRDSSWAQLDDVQQRMVEYRIREAELGGIALQGQELERFKQIQSRLAELGTQFSNNVLDSDKQFSLLLTELEQVKGIPSPVLAMMARNAADGEDGFDPETGPWKVSLEGPVVSGILRNAEDRSLREAVYRANFTQASSGTLDNRPVIDEILRLRKEQAALLGFGNFAEMNFHRKMADSAQTVWDFLAELREAAVPGASEHKRRLTDHARQMTADGSFELEIWDVSYWHEKLREELYGFSSEELRRYFPFERVLEGLFEFCGKMFGVRFEAADRLGSVWDPAVRLFKVFDETGEHIAFLYLDAFARGDEKRSGAWANFFSSRHRETSMELRLPSAWLICNQLPPVGDTPSLMTFGDVMTLFHEAGHTLHTMLTKIDFAWAAGNNNVEWDAIEIPSTFMENWCYDKETLLAFARDYETGAPMPDELFDKILASRTFGSGLSLCDLIWYTELDLEVHDRYDPDSDEALDELVQRTIDRNLLVKPPPEDQILCVFQHIFNSGYAAGYYTYLWSEMLSTDIYYAFVEAGRDRAYEVGKRLRDTFLALGSSRHPSDIFREFRGRDPQVRPMLEHLGLRPAGASSDLHRHLWA